MSEKNICKISRIEREMAPNGNMLLEKQLVVQGETLEEIIKIYAEEKKEVFMKVVNLDEQNKKV